MHTRFSSWFDVGPRRLSNSRKRSRKSGNVLIMFTLAMPFLLVPLVGLAIDGTMLYSIKAKLQAAVDGGAVAAAQSLSSGLTINAQTASATQTADQFVRANMGIPAMFDTKGVRLADKPGYWGANTLNDTTCGADGNPAIGGGNNCIVVAEDTTNTMLRTVQISVSVDIPLLFMRVLGMKKATVASIGTAARRDVVLVLVVDRSSSMSGRMANANAGAAYFVNNFAALRDRLGLVVFGGSAIIAYPSTDWGKDVRTAVLKGPDVNFKNTGDSDASPNMLRSIGNITSSSNTGTAEALTLAYKELAAAAQPGALNVIVLFTDGLPNGISAYFNDYSATGGYVKSNKNPAPANVGGSTCSWPKDPPPATPQVNPMHPMLGWIAQWGGFVSGGTDGNGVFTLMQTDQTTYTTVTDWLVSAQTTSRYPDGTLPAPPVTGAIAASPTAGCTFSQTVIDAKTNKRRLNSTVVSTDVVIPALDLYGNSTLGSPVAPYSQNDYQQSEIWNNECNSGSNKIGQLNKAALLKSNDACVVGLASWNATDMAARQIRLDPAGIKPVIYSMGYTGAAGVDEVLMKRICNVQTSTAPTTAHNTVYNAGAKEGLYIPIVNDDDVAPAYRRILAEVLRLSM